MNESIDGRAQTLVEHSKMLANTADYLSEHPTGPGADSLRERLQLLVDRVDFSKLTTEEFRAVAGFHAAAQSKKKASPIRAREYITPKD